MKTIHDVGLIKTVIDEFIEITGKTESLKCPESQRKSYYLKCCHLVYVYQKVLRIAPVSSRETVESNLKQFKEWMPVLRTVKV